MDLPCEEGGKKQGGCCESVTDGGECPAGRVVTRPLKNETHIMRRKGCSFLISGERIDEAMDPQAFTKQWWGKSTKCDRSLMLIFNLNT